MVASITSLHTTQKLSNKAQKAKAPGHLSAKTRQWFEKIVEGYLLEDHHLKILTLCAEAFDRSIEARKILEKDGIIVRDRFNKQISHPAVNIKRDAEICFARLLRELALDIAPPDSKPPTIKR